MPPSRNLLRNRLIAVAGSAAAVAASSSLALAHHPIGGAMPDTLASGLLSGLGHPVIGLDHLAFIIGAGIAAALAGSRLLLPALFIAATVVGCLLVAAGGIGLPAAEYVIAASVAAIGVMLMSGVRFGAAAFGALFAIAGLFHGGAYAEAVIGAETTPLLAYLAGFAFVQFAIMATAAWATGMAAQAPGQVATHPRLAGAVVAGVGATFLVEHVEKLAFAGL